MLFPVEHTQFSIIVIHFHESVMSCYWQSCFIRGLPKLVCGKKIVASAFGQTGHTSVFGHTGHTAFFRTRMEFGWSSIAQVGQRGTLKKNN